jgi:hypothetical protein
MQQLPADERGSEPRGAVVSEGERQQRGRGPESLRDASPMTLSPEDERTQSADMRPERHLSYDSV